MPGADMQGLTGGDSALTGVHHKPAASAQGQQTARTPAEIGHSHGASLP